MQYIASEKIADFLKNIDFENRDWKIYSRKTVDGRLYLHLKPKYARGGDTEFWFNDTHIHRIYNCKRNVDEEWAEYVFNVGLKPLLEGYFN